MIDKRLPRVRQQLEALSDEDLEAKAQVWRRAYREMLEYTLHGMHEIAVQQGIGLATAGEWLELGDVTEPGPELVDTDGNVVPTLALRSTRYYRGYALHIATDSADDGTWSYSVEVESDAGESLVRADGAGFPDHAEAFRAGMLDAVSAMPDVP